MNAAATNFDGVNKYIRITDIDEENLQYSNKHVVSPLGELNNKYLVIENDILLARTGASVGKSYLYSEFDGKLYFAGFLIRANIKNTINSKFIHYQLQTKKYKNWIILMSTRSGQPGINSKEYASLKVNLPLKYEQNKISNFLSLIDQRIITQRKLIENYKSLIKIILRMWFYHLNST